MIIGPADRRTSPAAPGSADSPGPDPSTGRRSQGAVIWDGPTSARSRSARAASVSPAIARIQARPAATSGSLSVRLRLRDPTSLAQRVRAAPERRQGHAERGVRTSRRGARAPERRVLPRPCRRRHERRRCRRGGSAPGQPMKTRCARVHLLARRGAGARERCPGAAPSRATAKRLPLTGPPPIPGSASRGKPWRTARSVSRSPFHSM